MKKKLEAELISIAHRILQLKDKSSLPQLQEEARQLYEKLTILSFAESHFEEPQPTIGQIYSVFENENESEVESETASKLDIETENVVETEIETEVVVDFVPEPEEIVEESKARDAKPELVIEEVNARVTEDLFVPAAAPAEEHASFSTTTLQEEEKETNEEKPKSLNDRLKKDIHIGLNDRLAYIKYLFDGSAPDYNRVLSQLETMASKKEVMDFITTMIKPDYNDWKDKEEYEERFMDAVLGKFDS